MASVNEQLQDRSVRHATYIERVKAGSANELVALLSRSEGDLIEKIRKRVERIAERGFDTGPRTTAQLNALLEQLREINAEAYAGFSGQLESRLEELAKSEATFQAGMLREELPDIVVAKLGVSRPDLRTLFKIAKARPFQGKLLSEWMGKLETDAATRVRDQIRIGLVEGEPIDAIVRRIRGTRALGYRDGVLDINRRNAQAIVRTAVGHTVGVARQETYSDNSDIIKGVEWIATLDVNRTCLTCMGLDGKVFPVNSGRRPLAHIGCRCSTAPITKSFRELGIDLDEIPEGTRRAMDGSVPASMDYNQWLRRQSAEDIEDALGPTRAKLFRQGKLDVSKFTDIRGRELTLDQLRQREASAFSRAEL